MVQWRGRISSTVGRPTRARTPQVKSSLKVRPGPKLFSTDRSPRKKREAVYADVNGPSSNRMGISGRREMSPREADQASSGLLLPAALPGMGSETQFSDPVRDVRNRRRHPLAARGVSQWLTSEQMALRDVCSLSTAIPVVSPTVPLVATVWFTAAGRDRFSIAVSRGLSHGRHPMGFDPESRPSRRAGRCCSGGRFSGCEASGGDERRIVNEGLGRSAHLDRHNM